MKAAISREIDEVAEEPGCVAHASGVREMVRAGSRRGGVVDDQGGRRESRCRAEDGARCAAETNAGSELQAKVAGRVEVYLVGPRAFVLFVRLSTVRQGHARSSRLDSKTRTFTLES